jgi:predicted nucleic acid-binding Zn ribbon protein
MTFLFTMKSVNSMLGSLLVGVAARSGRGGPLSSVWREAVGETVARHSTPRRLEAGRLVVACDAAQWRDSLEAQAPSLLVRVQAVVGDGSVRALDFQWP